MSDGQSVTDLATNIHWTEKLEDYFASTGEKAHCLAWVHKRSEALYSVRKTFIDLPVIVGSGLIAFLNAGSSSLFNDARLSSIALGVGSLVLGIMNTMGTYFGWAKRAEGHRISAIHYAKLYRFIAVEMSLPREERTSPHDLLKFVKDQYDRLAEISPLVPSTVIQEFTRKFHKIKDISKPEETNGLEKITVYKSNPGDESGGSSYPSTPVSTRTGSSGSSSKSYEPKKASTSKDTSVTFRVQNPLHRLAAPSSVVGSSVGLGNIRIGVSGPKGKSSTKTEDDTAFAPSESTLRSFAESAVNLPAMDAGVVAEAVAETADAVAGVVEGPPDFITSPLVMKND